MKQQLSIIDNSDLSYHKDDGEKVTNVDRIKKDMEAELTFIEPQSLNFHAKLNQIYLEYAKQKTTTENQGFLSMTPFDNMLDAYDDMLVSASSAASLIRKKRSDNHFMKKLHKECEQYYKDNPDKFEESKKIKETAKMNYELNTIEVKHKKKGPGLMPHELKVVEGLVRKRLKRLRLDIIFEDDQ